MGGLPERVVLIASVCRARCKSGDTAHVVYVSGFASRPLYWRVRLTARSARHYQLEVADGVRLGIAFRDLAHAWAILEEQCRQPLLSQRIVPRKVMVQPREEQLGMPVAGYVASKRDRDGGRDVPGRRPPQIHRQGRFSILNCAARYAAQITRREHDIATHASRLRANRPGGGLRAGIWRKDSGCRGQFSICPDYVGPVLDELFPKRAHRWSVIHVAGRH